MAKIKLHNPELAANSKFANLVVESLTTDPTISGTASVGRLWFNSTDKIFKGGFLDADGTATEIKSIGIDNSAEVAANTAAIATNTADISSLDTRLTTAETTLTNNETDITNLQAELDNTQMSSGLNADGSYTADTTTNYLTTATSLSDADKKLDAQNKTTADALAKEVTDRTDADTALDTKITNVNSTLQDNIDTLTTDIQTNYLNKTTSTAQVIAADTTFQGNMVISGDLTISGTSTTVETEILKVADNIITLNDGIGDVDPTENAGLEVDRGNAGITKILNWNETLDQVEVQEDGELRKIATINYVDSEITSTENDISALDTRLTTAESNITSNDSDISTLQNDLTTETTNRTNADTALDDKITDQAANIGDLTKLTTDAKDTLVKAINEVDAHTNTNASDLATEITNRTNADTNIQNELDTTQTGAGLNTDGTYTADTLTNYITTATDLMNADKLLDSQIKTNADTTSALDTRVTTVESQVNGKIGDLTNLTTDDKDTLVKAINEVDNHIDTEITNRTNADNTLQTNITSEETARTNADNDLTTRIDNVNTASGISNDTYTADTTTNYLANATDLMNADKVLDTTIKTNLDNLAATTASNGANLVGFEGYTESDTNIVNPTIEIDAGTLKSSIDTIASSVNAKIQEIENMYVKGEVAEEDKSDTYTIAHNLGTVFVDVSVQVYDSAESVWRFDLVIIEVIDENTVKISLAKGDAEQIRYVIQGY